MLPLFVFFFYCSIHHRDLHSFPTRRSSDLLPRHGCARNWNRMRRACRTRPVSSPDADVAARLRDRKSTRLNSSHVKISYAVFCLKKKKSVGALAEVWLSSKPPPYLTALTLN